MEHAQRALVVRLQGNSATGLNPYFNGTCSKRNYDGVKGVNGQPMS